MRRHRSQKGVALLVVMVVVLLAALLFTSAVRTAWFNELITGSEVDYQRAFDNAQALLRDAEFDIQGLHPDGRPCHEAAGHEGNCRRRGSEAAAGGQPWFPRHGPGEFESLRALLAAKSPSCMEGICVSDGVAAEFWRLSVGEVDRMKAVAAHYGEFSGAPSMQASNPLLMAKGWYWVEILPFDAGAPASPGTEALLPDADTPYIFRITAVSEGRKPATRAVLQSLLVLKKGDS